MVVSLVRSCWRWSLLVSLLLSCAIDARAQQPFAIQSVTQRPFVTGVTPVIGPGGFVGGVLVNPQGVVSRPAQDASEQNSLQNQRIRARQLQAKVPDGPARQKELLALTKMRMISLKKLDVALSELVDRRESPSEEMFFLAGLQRIEFIFVFPQQGDVVLAGPAEPWRVAAGGEVVGMTSGLPAMRLDDLIDALRIADSARSTGISCSIEPTPEGLRRYAKLIGSRRFSFQNRSSRGRPPGFDQSVRAMQQAMGTQQVLVDGVPTDSHFARVLVGADYIMKLLAMGLEESPIADMPGYLQMLSRQHTGPQIASPRWWMTPNYQPVTHSADRLAWRIRGQGVKTLTEDSFLGDDGKRSVSRDANPIALRWADSMTENFEQLVTAFPVFGQLRGCMDMAVAGALIAQRDLWNVANCQLEVLLDSSRLRGPRLQVPTTVDSQASFVRGRAGWIVAVSGGVEIDPWSVVDNAELDESLDMPYDRAAQTAGDRWWW